MPISISTVFNQLACLGNVVELQSTQQPSRFNRRKGLIEAECVDRLSSVSPTALHCRTAPPDPVTPRTTKAPDERAACGWRPAMVWSTDRRRLQALGASPRQDEGYFALLQTTSAVLPGGPIGVGVFELISRDGEDVLLIGTYPCRASPLHLQQIERIATGWRLRPIADPIIICTHAQTPEAIFTAKLISPPDLSRCEELGAALQPALG